MEYIEVRGHHLLCIPRYYRECFSDGYGKVFAENMKNICKQIRANPSLQVKLISEKPDVLCKKCDHLIENKCTNGNNMSKWVENQDVKTLEYLKLKPNSIYVAKDVFNLAMNEINDENFSEFCQGCAYVDNCTKIGINRSFAKDLNRK